MRKAKYLTETQDISTVYRQLLIGGLEVGVPFKVKLLLQSDGGLRPDILPGQEGNED